MAERWLKLLVLTTLTALAGCRNTASSREHAARGIGEAPPKAESSSAAAVGVTREKVDRASALMTAFAERTGITSDRPQRRYLWTDAFAVCNFLGLARETGDAKRQPATNSGVLNISRSDIGSKGNANTSVTTWVNDWEWGGGGIAPYEMVRTTQHILIAAP